MQAQRAPRKEDVRAVHVQPLPVLRAMLEAPVLIEPPDRISAPVLCREAEPHSLCCADAGIVVEPYLVVPEPSALVAGTARHLEDRNDNRLALRRRKLMYCRSHCKIGRASCRERV